MFSVALIGALALTSMGIFFRPVDESVTQTDQGATGVDSIKLQGVLRTLGMFLLGFILLIAGVTALYKNGVLTRDTITERLSKTLVQKLNESELPANIIIVDGGSYAHRAIDGEALSQRLQNQGYPNLVVQASLPGANHHERVLLLRPLFSALEKKSDIGMRRVILLYEVHSGYDTYPLNQVRSVNDRLVGYAEASSSIRQVKAMFSISEEPLIGAHKDAMQTLIRATAVNTLGVGRLRDVKRPENLTPYPGYNPINENRKNVPDDVHKSAYTFVNNHILGPNAAKGAPSSRAKRRWAWVDTLVDPELTRLKSKLVDEKLAYLPITTNRRDLRYFNSYCRDPVQNCLFVDQAYYDLLKSFDNNTYWSDPNHLSVKGAEAYTAWLVDTLVAQDALKK